MYARFLSNIIIIVKNNTVNNVKDVFLPVFNFECDVSCFIILKFYELEKFISVMYKLKFKYYQYTEIICLYARFINFLWGYSL